MTATLDKTTTPTDDIDLSFVDESVARIGRTPDKCIPLLQALQEHYRYLPQPALERVCALTEITPAAISGVATFYAQFRHLPMGKHLVSVCHGTACHVKGAPLISDALARELNIPEGEDTDPDGVFTVQKVACLGCCTLAPVMTIDGVTYGHLTTENIPRAITDFNNLVKSGALGLPNKEFTHGATGLAEIRIGVGSCCIAGGSMKVREELDAAIHEVNAEAVIKPVGCVGMCHQTPLVEVVMPSGKSTIYAKVQPDDAAEIIHRHFKPKGLLRKLSLSISKKLTNFLTDESWEPVTRYAIDVRDAPVCAFLGEQKHIATELSGSLDPLDLDAYIAADGFVALRKVLDEGKPEQVIAEVKASGLRGRGGAGFSTGTKWEFVRGAQEKQKYVVMNGDEGDPGAFMDRMLLESYPYRVLEGLAIAAFAIGAHEGVLYIRAEYPLAVLRINDAIKALEDKGYLGDRVMGHDYALKLRIMEGAGAFVCGEETALLASIEGKRGMPRLRPPYPAVKGLWGKPTLINNVESYALVSWIIRHGAKAFADLGTEKSKGTKVFALAGKVNRGGLIEVPMGMTLRQIVEEIGGGVADEQTLKAVQIGGPSGGCLPTRMLDTAVDYEALNSAGAIMGSGGLVVMDQHDCMVDMARYFLEFTQEQSCGKCTYCRVGTKRMLDILERLCAGAGKNGDLEKLEDLAYMVMHGSICGLGQTAPNPVITTLRYFRDEYLAHLQGKCPAGKCKNLIKYRITDDCIGCTKCAQVCPVDAIPIAPYQIHVVDDEKCTRCDSCRSVCPTDAIVIE